MNGEKHDRNHYVKNVRELNVYKLAFRSAMDIFYISKQFPTEEKYSLTDQIRRASRSVCSHLLEGWRKRKYRAVFINKLSDSSQEAAETQTWLEFSLKCQYIDFEVFNMLYREYDRILGMLNAMESKAEYFCGRK